MAIQRQPGDISDKTESRVANFLYKSANGGIQSGSSTQTVHYDFRRTYSKGAVVILPNGGRFRKSTSYSHESWYLTEGSPSVAVSKSGAWYATDNGREQRLMLNGSPRLHTNIPSDARNEAVTKALTKMADQKINLGENLATLGQTASMVASKSALLADALYLIKNKKEFLPYLRRSARDLGRKGVDNKIADLYLEYVYGLRPLVSDVYTGIELMKEHAGRDLLLKASGTAQRVIPFGRQSGQISGSYSRAYRESGTYTGKVKCTLWATIDPEWQGLRALNQLGLLNPLGLAWDLVPYSFVVDWFLPVGDVLYALSARAGLKFVDGSISGKAKEDSQMLYFINNGTWSDAVLGSGQVSPMRVTRVYQGYTRERLTNWPLPGFYMASDPLGFDRSLKALALAIKRLRLR